MGAGFREGADMAMSEHAETDRKRDGVNSDGAIGTLRSDCAETPTEQVRMAVQRRFNTCQRAKARSTKPAAASARASSPKGAITCTPSGGPSPGTGTVTQGTPRSVQSRLKRESPVEA